MSNWSRWRNAWGTGNLDEPLGVERERIELDVVGASEPVYRGADHALLQSLRGKFVSASEFQEFMWCKVV